jgi:hypothetical protein
MLDEKLADEILEVASKAGELAATSVPEMNVLPASLKPLAQAMAAGGAMFGAAAMWQELARRGMLKEPGA